MDSHADEKKRGESCRRPLGTPDSCTSFQYIISVKSGSLVHSLLLGSSVGASMADSLTWGSALHRERCSPSHFFTLEAFQTQKFIFLKRRKRHTASKNQEGLCHRKGDACCLCLEDTPLGGRGAVGSWAGRGPHTQASPLTLT